MRDGDNHNHGLDADPEHDDTNGDGTLRTTLADIAREIPWPRGFTARIRRNAFTDRWQGREEALAKDIAVEAPRYRQAFFDGDPDNTGVWFGEAAGLIDSVDPAATIIERMVSDAASRLVGHGNARVVMP